MNAPTGRLTSGHVTIDFDKKVIEVLDPPLKTAPRQREDKAS